MGLLATALIGCKTVTEEIYIDEMYQKAYITAEVYPQNEGSYVRNDVMTSPSLKLDGSNRLVASPGGVVTTDKGAKSQEVSFRTVYNVKKDLTGTMSALKNPEEYVANYNAEHGLTQDDAYQVLGKEFYNITASKSVIRTGFNKGEESFAVELAEDLSALAPGKYLLPLTVEVDDPNIEISSNRGVYNYLVTYTYTDARDPNEENIEVGRILTSDEFTGVLEAGSTWVGTFNNLFDANNSTYWMSSSTTAPRIRVTFNDPVELRKIGFVAYTVYGSTYYIGMIRCSYKLADGSTIDYPSGYYSFEDSTQILNIYDTSEDLSAGAMVKEVAFYFKAKTSNYCGVTDIYFIVKD